MIIVNSKAFNQAKENNPHANHQIERSDYYVYPCKRFILF